MQYADHGALVPAGAAAACTIAGQAALVERLRADREAHRHTQIWTKDAHGGPYRKVRAAPRPRADPPGARV